MENNFLKKKNSVIVNWLKTTSKTNFIISCLSNLCYGLDKLRAY